MPSDPGSPPDGPVSVRDGLPLLGFEADWSCMTDQLPGFRLRVGALDLTAAEVMTKHFQPCFFVSGLFSAKRSIGLRSVELPLVVESMAQLKALLAYVVGDTPIPEADLPWLREGKAAHHLLPWEQSRAAERERARQHEALRARRPHCYVQRDWLRLLRKQVRDALPKASPEDAFEVTFDGRLISVRLSGAAFLAPAYGQEPWRQAFVGSIRLLERMPKRFTEDPIAVGIWDGRLEFGSVCLGPALERDEASDL